MKRSLNNQVNLSHIPKGTDAGCLGAGSSCGSTTSSVTQAFPSSYSADHTVGICLEAQPLMVSGWLQELQTSRTYMPLPKSLMRSHPFLCPLLTFQKTSFPEASQQTSFPVLQVRVLSHFSHSVSDVGEWAGRAVLAQSLRGCSHLKAGLGSGDLLPRWLAHMADHLVLAIGGRPWLHRLLQGLLECPHSTAAGFP